ncbi:MAG: hypothetical protein E5Y76_02260 [Mesorhizobium sp.]|nr:MAG: hypothetical protein E5Y76_02260 [Mesorhizobium sp.]
MQAKGFDSTASTHLRAGSIAMTPKDLNIPAGAALPTRWTPSSPHHGPCTVPLSTGIVTVGSSVIDGYINVMWPKVEALQMPEAQERTRQIIGWIGIAGFVVLFGALAMLDRNNNAARQKT